MIRGSISSQISTAYERTTGLSRFWKEIAEWNALICSIGFFVLFTAFGTVQNYATSSHGNDGAISLSILYIAFTVSNLFIAKIASCIPPRIAMVLGAITYALYVGSNIAGHRVFLFSSAALMGFGAALLWVAQGSHMARCSRELEQKYKLSHGSTMGYFVGIFFGWFAANQFVGNSLAAALFYADTSSTTVYVVFCSINILGVFTFLFIRPFPEQMDEVQDEGHDVIEMQNEGHDAQKQTASASKVDEIELLESNQLDDAGVSPTEPAPVDDADDLEPEAADDGSIFAMISLWATKQMLMLIPLTIFSGISQTFIYGHFPAMIEDEFEKFAALAVIGAVDAICSVVFGRLSDRIGKLPILSISFGAFALVFSYFFAWDGLSTLHPLHSLKLQCAVGVFLGVGNAGCNTQLYTMYECLLGKESAVFANLKFWQSLAMTWGFLSSGIGVRSEHAILSCFIVLILAAAPLYFSAEVRAKSRPSRTPKNTAS